MPESPKLRVFLCHASQNKPIVRELYQRLLAEGRIDPWLDEEKLLPGQDWDLVIAGLHCGMEWEFFSRQHQMKIARQLAEAGADAVIGHHAHVIQPMEWYQTKRDLSDLSPSFTTWATLFPFAPRHSHPWCLIAQLNLVQGRMNGTEKTLVEDVRLTPVIQLTKMENSTIRASLEKLQSEIANPPSSYAKEYAAEAAPYADLVLGNGWRNS